MTSPKKILDIDCEFCKKSFVESTILRHIGQSNDCKAHYGKRFIEMKKEKAREKVYRSRQKMTMKEKKRSLKRKRISYAQNEELKEKKQTDLPREEGKNQGKK